MWQGQGQSGGGGFSNFTASLANMMNKRQGGQDGQTTQKQVYCVNGRRYIVHQTIPQQQYSNQQQQYPYQMAPMGGQQTQMNGMGMMQQSPPGYQMQQGQQQGVQGMQMQPTMDMQQTGYQMQNPGMPGYGGQQGYQHQGSIDGGSVHGGQQGYQHQGSVHGGTMNAPFPNQPQGTIPSGYSGQPIQNPQMMPVSSSHQMGMTQSGYAGQPTQTPQMMPMQNIQSTGMMQMGQTGHQGQPMQTPQMTPIQNVQTGGLMQTEHQSQPIQTTQMMQTQSTMTAMDALNAGMVFSQTGTQGAGEAQPTESVMQSSIPMSTVNAAASLKPGDLFGQRYMIEGPVPSKPNDHYGVDKFSGKKVILVWCTPGDALNSFIQFHYSTKQKYKNICKLLDVEQEKGYLPCLIFERGDMTLEQWISQNPEEDRMPLLMQMATALQTLHTANYIHGALDPSQVVMFSEKKKCKLMVTRPCVTGTAAPMHPSMLYCAPESIVARQEGKMLMADACIDMFAFGAIAFSMITGQSLYGPSPSVNVIVHHVQSALPYPVATVQGASREVLENLLSYDSRLRWTAAKVLSSSAFSKSVSTQEGKEVGASESQKLAQAMNEMRLSGVIVSVGVEYFTSKSNPADPFYQREARMVDTMKDDYLKNEPIFITRVQENYRLRINLTNEKHQALPIKSINYIRVAAMDGCSIFLQSAQSLVTTRSQEVLCFFDPSRCNSMKLMNVGEQYGGLMDKYVKLDITVGVTMAGTTEQDMELNEHIFLLRIPNTGGTMVQDCKEYFSKRWESLPQWQRNAVKIASKMGFKPMMKMTSAALGGL